MVIYRCWLNVLNIIFAVISLILQVVSIKQVSIEYEKMSKRYKSMKKGKKKSYKKKLQKIHEDQDEDSILAAHAKKAKEEAEGEEK